MEKLVVDLENCYGICKLEYEFDFSRQNGCLIYASNGTMKTSFAKTFLDISNSDMPSDRIYGRPTTANIQKMDNGTLLTIEPEDIFVIESFKDEFNFEKISRLLVNNELKNKYDRLFNDIQKAKDRLIKKMASLSKLRQADVEEKFIEDFKDYDDSFLDILISLEDKIDGNIEIPVKDIRYKVIFDDRVINFIKNDEIFNSIDEYSAKYSELIDKSAIFEKNVFTHNNAITVGKDLDKNGFFKAKHQVTLKTGTLIKSKIELEKLIDEEKEDILSDDRLKELFEKIDSGLDRNNEAREFKRIIGNYPEIIPELNDIPKFKQSIWISIFNTEKEIFSGLIGIYKNGKDDIEEIIREAKDEESSWRAVIELFNKRFFVPFKVNLINQEDVVLKDKVKPTVEFIYGDDTEEKCMNKDELLGILSNGEKKALYLLNVIYEIEARKLDGNPVLIILDDIADSFDYQNKYAIVEYLNDILKEDFFKLIILTHNFDFYRTVHSRLNIPRDNCHMVLKEPNEIKIVPGQYLNSAFNFWKRQLNGNIANNHKRTLIAAIPFVRNLIEYVDGKDSNDYKLLTDLLHIKENSASRRLSDLQRIYTDVWNVNFRIDYDDTIFDLIFQEAESIIGENIDGINLENKITLSIAIRLIAEDYMISKISDTDAISGIRSYQTRNLYKLFKEENNIDPIISTLEQVNLMTPENIHMNSFMYEPILDMSDNHLKNLYNEIKEANDARNST